MTSAERTKCASQEWNNRTAATREACGNKLLNWRMSEPLKVFWQPD